MSKGSRERKNFYAIHRGRCPPCITTSWLYANAQVNRFQNNQFKGFNTFSEAKTWLLEQFDPEENDCRTFHFMKGSTDGPKSQTSENGGHPEAYAVAKGRKPGVYDNYRDAEAQVKGYSGATFKSHATAEYAYASLDSADGQSRSRDEFAHTDEGIENEDIDSLVREMAETSL